VKRPERDLGGTLNTGPGCLRTRRRISRGFFVKPGDTSDPFWDWVKNYAWAHKGAGASDEE